MTINIGFIIKKVADDQNLSQSQLATLIDDVQQNVGNDYKRTSLKIDRIFQYSKALNHNFLQYYYNEEPYKTFRERENEAFLSEIKELKEQLEDANKTISLQESHIKTQQELIETQRALIVKLKG
ncbi:hypothetical protein [Sphingobacterium kitahiroshimense]|uniref:HTH cro/C1-type domain-containing protein n=1 Tax=Sphingobacterium kitahiroshimense TaxID=470446 RepID=A0ABV0BQP1_9SPHI